MGKNTGDTTKSNHNHFANNEKKRNPNIKRAIIFISYFDRLILKNGKTICKLCLKNNSHADDVTDDVTE